MVIAKPEWFNRRNKPFYSYGMTWQGWIYLIVTISVLFTGIILPQNMVTGIIITLMFLFLFMDNDNSILQVNG